MRFVEQGKAIIQTNQVQTLFQADDPGEVAGQVHPLHAQIVPKQFLKFKTRDPEQGCLVVENHPIMILPGFQYLP